MEKNESETRGLGTILIYAMTATGIVAGIVGYLTGYLQGSNNFTPKTVYTQDLNENGRSDIIVTGAEGRNYIFLQSEDGKYISLQKVEEDMKRSAEVKASELENTVRESIGSEEQW